MIKLGILSNFAFSLNSTGGSEVVLHQIAKRLVRKYNYEVISYAYNTDKTWTCEGVVYKNCWKGRRFLDQIKHDNLDHLFVYSDSFFSFKEILSEQGQVTLSNLSMSIALLGMYNMRENKSLFESFKKQRKRFRVITHSMNYIDYEICHNNGISVTIIPNGVDLNEFSYENKSIPSKEKFRDKYNIKNKYIILNVANYFFGKGQNHLVPICSQLRDKDFVLIQISCSVKYPYEQTFLNSFKRDLQQGRDKFEFKVLRNIPREDVVAAFKASNLFLFTSLKEVFPLVILESMVAYKPFISMDVGCISELTDGLGSVSPPGIVIKNNEVDVKGYKVITSDIIKEYVDRTDFLLNEPDICEEMGRVGNLMIENRNNWDDIVDLYHNVFIL